jgi:ribosome-associated toxin RatA of RatAB toxin-antitoxin module
MKVFERSAIVGFTPAQMFALVDDVPRYPEFLPGCKGANAQIVSDTERVASIDIAKGNIKLAFTTRNTVQPNSSVHMQLIEGPFKHLVGHWGFSPMGERGARVGFRVEFEFKSRLMAVALNPLFESVCDKIVDAFVHRARNIYGPPIPR